MHQMDLGLGPWLECGPFYAVKTHEPCPGLKHGYETGQLFLMHKYLGIGPSGTQSKMPILLLCVGLKIAYLVLIL